MSYIDLGKKVLMVGGAIYFGGKVLDYISSAAQKNISYTIGRVRVNWAASSNGRIVVDVPIQLQNSNAFGVTVQAVTGKVHYGTTEIAQVNLPLAVTIMPNDIANFTVQISFNSAQIFNDITNSIQTNGAMAALVNPIHFQGIVRTNAISIPIDTNIPIA